MNKLFEEYSNYEELNIKKEQLLEELIKLSGHNDEESLNRINEIAEEIRKTNEEIELYNTENLDKLKAYYQTKKEFERLVGELQTIEKLSKKSKREKVKLLSAEGRTKEIDKELEEEYKLLAEQKKKLRVKFEKQYQNIKNISEIKLPLEKTPSLEEKPVTYVLPEIKEYEDLTVDEKIKITEERLERIFNSRYIPNQGKKIIVKYNNGKEIESKVIPEKYLGIYKSTMIELSNLKNQKDDLNSKKVQKEENKVLKREPKVVRLKAKVVAKTEVLEPQKENTPIEVPSFEFNEIPVSSVEKPHEEVKTVEEVNGFNFIDMDKPTPSKTVEADIDADMKIAYFKNDKYKNPKSNSFEIEEVPLARPKVEPSVPKVEEPKIIPLNMSYLEDLRKEKKVELHPVVETTFRNKINIPLVKEKVKEYSSQKLKELKKNIQEITQNTKKVVTEEAYQIINRVANFKEDTCQRVSSIWGQIGKTTKDTISKLKAPFDKLRESDKVVISRKELEYMVKVVIEENKRLQEENKRLVLAKQSGGYIVTTTLVIIGTLILSAIIFVVVGSILG